jgi:hypothetical protein
MRNYIYLATLQSAELTRAVRTRLWRSIEERTTSAIFVQVALLKRCIDGVPLLLDAELIEVARRILADQGDESPSAATQIGASQWRIRIPHPRLAHASPASTPTGQPRLRLGSAVSVARPTWARQANHL